MDKATPKDGFQANRDRAAPLLAQLKAVTGADAKMRVAQEEVFGPFLTVIPFKDEAEAVRVMMCVEQIGEALGRLGGTLRRLRAHDH